jgi:predicted phosphodiesterase
MIGILSDTHDNLTRVREAVRLFNDAGCDLVVHARDFIALSVEIVML